MNRGTGSFEPLAAGGEAGAQAPGEGLPYTVELWDIGRSRLERVLARAATIQVASAIFEAATRDHPCRLVVLRRGAELVRSTD